LFIKRLKASKVQIQMAKKAICYQTCLQSYEIKIVLICIKTFSKWLIFQSLFSRYLFFQLLFFKVQYVQTTNVSEDLTEAPSETWLRSQGFKNQSYATAPAAISKIYKNKAFFFFLFLSNCFFLFWFCFSNRLRLLLKGGRGEEGDTWHNQ
jgi:hypothetical protein